MLDNIPFSIRFEALTGHGPFPWQIEMFQRFLRGDLPEACDIPTGLGKTSIIPIWLLALAERGRSVPRRLIYVVNRRTVVDQATDEAIQIRAKLENFESGDPRPSSGIIAARHRVADDLRCLTANSKSVPFAISTLRGQFADNREWSADPGRPAVIVGTVDMIGSRLLFGGYGCGFKTRPLHAGFLGYDSLLVHDESHLEPAFQQLIEAIRDEQRDRELAPLGEEMRFKVMELTATTRGSGKLLRLTTQDRSHPEVVKRIGAKKSLVLHSFEGYDDKDKLPEKLVELALVYENAKQAVLIFARSVETVETVAMRLEKAGKFSLILTGTMRGWERDRLVEHPAFKRFLPRTVPADDDETVYLVATSAGEVGVNISADHLVCDLSTFESMAQRFGRVNRFGRRDDTRINVVHPKEFDDKELSDRLRKTLALLVKLDGKGSPDAIDSLDREERYAAFSPEPATLLTSDILFDAWSLTTIRDDLPGRPPLEPFLRGVTDPEFEETQVAWRDEVRYLSGPRWNDDQRSSLLEDFPLKPHELLRDRSSRVFRHLEGLSKRHSGQYAWVVAPNGKVTALPLDELADKDRKERIHGQTILLSPEVGGLNKGLLDEKSTGQVEDVASEALPSAPVRRCRIRYDAANVIVAKPGELTPLIEGMRLIYTIDMRAGADELDEEDEPGLQVSEFNDGNRTPLFRFWRWYELPRSADGEGSGTAQEAVLWAVHTEDVYRRAEAIVAHLTLPDQIKRVVVLAAFFHDFGKLRSSFQRTLGNITPDRPLAKSASNRGSVKLETNYRHEFGSLLQLEALLRSGATGSMPSLAFELAAKLGYDIHAELDWVRSDDDLADLARHLLATHHGRGRPHFPPDEIFDPEHPRSDATSVASAIPRRFARLQRRYGRWGLAYLESVLRAADYAASAQPSETLGEQS